MVKSRGDHKPSGGSTLKRLKSTLKQIGMIGQPVKRSARHKLTTTKSDVGEKVKQLREKPSPFELKFNREKHNILGRKMKGSIGRPGVSKLRGFENRKKTLGKELKTKARVGTFTDRRIGEGDPTLSVEDKILERFAREKQKRAEKKTLYQLQSDDDEYELTHFGQALSNLSNDVEHHDPRLDEEDEDNGAIDHKTVSRLHFGGSDQESGEAPTKKTYNEIMKEVIAKSKFYKMERQKERTVNEELNRTLNNDLKEIQSLLFEVSDQQKKEKPSKGPSAYDDFDEFVVDLARDKKAKPSDRLKTEDEKVKEEAERLQELERKRQRRMKGLESDNSSDEEQTSRVPVGDDLGDDFDLQNLSNSEDDSREPQALVYKDGKLVNGHQLYMKPQKKTNVEGHESESCEEEFDENSDGLLSQDDDEVEEEFENEIKEEEEFQANVSEEHEGSHFEDEIPFDGELAVKPDLDRAYVVNKANSTVIESIPYTFECPSTFKEMRDLMRHKSLEDQITVISRLQILYHPSLNPANKEKLQNLFNLILHHVVSSVKQNLKDCTAGVAVCDAFYPVIKELSTKYPDTATEFVIDQLKRFQINARERSKKQDMNSICIPMHEFLSVLLFGRIFSTTDYRHPVLTPTYLLFGEWLNSAAKHVSLLQNLNVKDCLQNMTIGLLIAQTWIDFQGDSGRYAPDLIGFLFVCSHVLLTLRQPTLKFNPQDLSYPGFVKHTYTTSRIKNVPEDNEIIQPFHIFTDTVESLSAEALWAVVLKGCLKTVTALSTEYLKKENVGGLMQQHVKAEDGSPLLLSDIYVTLPTTFGWCWTEIFDGFIHLLECVDRTDKFLQSTIEATLNGLKQMRDNIKEQNKVQCEKLGVSSRTRMPLQWQQKETQGIGMFNPKFQQQGFNPDKKYDPDPVRSEQKKLRSLHKKEMKGAIRELRKDASFLASTSVDSKKIESETYQKKIKRIYGLLGAEKGEMNAEQRMKRPKRK